MVWAATPTWRTLAPQVVHKQVHAVGVGEKRRRELNVAPFRPGPDSPGPTRRTGRQHLLAGSLVGDDGHRPEEIVAVRVVPVMVRIDQRVHGAAGHLLDRIQVGPRATFRRAGVDTDHAPASHQEAGIVDPPTAVGLDVGEYAVTDFLDPRRCQIARSHGRTRSRSNLARSRRGPPVAPANRAVYAARDGNGTGVTWTRASWTGRASWNRRELEQGEQRWNRVASWNRVELEQWRAGTVASWNRVELEQGELER